MRKQATWHVSQRFIYDLPSESVEPVAPYGDYQPDQRWAVKEVLIGHDSLDPAWEDDGFPMVTIWIQKVTKKGEWSKSSSPDQWFPDRSVRDSTLRDLGIPMERPEVALPSGEPSP